jgi:hypothetical protein
VRRVHALNFFIAFSFTVMADPISSVAYAIEAALHELEGDLSHLLPTMLLVVATVAIVAGTYHQLIGRFPSGGGGPEGVAAAFGESWAFLPLAALLIDFTLTVAISCAAGAAALISYLPELAPGRLPIAVGLAVVVAAGIVIGHRGRVIFATATLLFLGGALVVLIGGLEADPAPGVSTPPLLASGEGMAILLAMPLGMALATGIESPSNAIGQLGGLSDRGRRLFGQLTIWMLVAIVGGLTLTLTALAVSLGVSAPGENSTLLAEIARRATGGGATFAGFQALTALLLLAAAASAYAAASGVLRALAMHGSAQGTLLPRRFAVSNRFFVPVWGVGAVALAACVLIALAAGRETDLVGFYAVAVFISFLAALIGCARLSWRERRPLAFAVNCAGLVPVTYVLLANSLRLDGVVSIVATLLLAAGLWWSWVRRGRPEGVATAAAERSSHGPPQR